MKAVRFKKPTLARKKLKGMTLIECIIALLVFTLMGAMMAVICSTVTSLMLNTNHMNNKTNAESPAAAVQDVTALHGLTDAAGNPIEVETQPTVIRVTSGSFNTNVNADRYSTQGLAEASSQNCDTNMNGDLQFYVIH